MYCIYYNINIYGMVLDINSAHLRQLVCMIVILGQWPSVEYRLFEMRVHGTVQS